MLSSSKIRLILPDRCQLKCKACHKEHNPEPFDTDLSCLFSRLHELSLSRPIAQVNISGGEPFHSANLADTMAILKHIAASYPTATVSLNTNAVSIRRDIVASLAGAVDYVKVSLYGLDDTDYHSYTGVKCGRTVLGNLAVLRRAGVDVCLNVLATRDLLDERRIRQFIGLARTLRARLKFVEIIAHDWFDEARQKSAEDLYIDICKLQELLLALGATLENAAAGRNHLTMAGTNILLYRYPCSGLHCGACREMDWGWFVRSDGRVGSICGRPLDYWAEHTAIHCQAFGEPAPLARLWPHLW